MGENAKAIDQETLLKLARPLLKPEMIETVRKLPAVGGFIALKDLKEAGLPFEFDIEQMTLSFFPTADQRPGGHVTLSEGGDLTPAEQFYPRATVSGYINFNGSAQYSSGGSAPSETLGISGAIRVMNLVIESEAAIAQGAIARQGTRAVYDDPAKAIRYMAGDITPATVGMQTGTGFLGVSIQKSYGKLQPQKNIRPTGQRSFRLERPSEVDIIVNGQVVRRLQMPPGDHDVSELPLKAGENMLTLEITDDTGQHTTLTFTVFFDYTLLAPGVSEWGLAAGYRSDTGASAPFYYWNDRAATAYYRLGLTENVTATAHVQADPHAAVAGLMAVAPTWLGRMSVEIAGSSGWYSSQGIAAALTYTPEALLKAWDIPGAIQVAADYRSAAFTPLFATSGTNGEAISVNGFYSLALPDDYSVSFSGNLAAGSAFSSTKLGGGLSISKSVQPDLSWTLAWSYDSAPAIPGSASGPWSVLGRINVKLAKDTELAFTQDGFNGTSVVGLSTTGQAGDGHYAIKADIEKDPHAVTKGDSEDQADFSASYSGTRFDVSASRSRRFFASSRGVISDVSVLSGAGAVAFADDHIAVGRTVTDSFAIVTPHKSLSDATLRVGGGGSAGARAASDSLGPALVSDLPSYSHSQLPIEADDAPEGYDLGSGVFDVQPGYKSGYVLKVGSEYAVIATGSLELEGKPLALLSGLAKEEGVADPRKVVVFTNGAGRFSAEGLKPGQWRIEMIGDPPPCFRLTVPEKASGIFDAGTLAAGCSR